MIELNDQDFKYVIQSFSNVFVGGRMTYEELGESDDTPGRLKDAVYRVFYKDVPKETMICDHLLSMKEEDMSYLAYMQLRIVVKVSFLDRKVDKKGNESESYITKDYKFEDFRKEDWSGMEDEILIQEISFTKRHLVMLHV